MGVQKEARCVGRPYCHGHRYILAYLDKQTASDVTTTIFTACIGYLVSYAAASTTEKVSRNRHGLDADGNPFQTNNTEGGSDTSGPTLG